MPNQDTLNLIKFRTGATESTDIANNIARFDFEDCILYYGGCAFGITKDELSKAVVGKVTSEQLLEALQPYALLNDVPSDEKIRGIATQEISKANKNTTLTNYATTGALNTLKSEVSGKTTLAEVEEQGYAKVTDIPTKVSDLTNDSNFITSSATVSQANKLTNQLTIKKNNVAIGTYDGSSASVISFTCPTKVSDLTNDSNFITSSDTIANANKVGNLTPSQISAMTNNTNKLTNGAGFITKSVTDLTNYYDKDSIDSLISSKLERVTASTLPTSGDVNKIYMIPKGTSETNNSFDEYMYISSKWELIGNSKTDLTDYYKKSETSGKTEISNALNAKSNTGHTHTSGDVSGLGTMALQNTSSYSSATQVNTALSKKSDTGHTHDDRYYTETEIDTKLSGKSDTGHTHDYLPLSGGTESGNVIFDNKSAIILQGSNGASGNKLVLQNYDTNISIQHKANDNGQFSAIDFPNDSPNIDFYIYGNKQGTIKSSPSITSGSVDIIRGKDLYSSMSNYLPLSGGTMTGGIMGFVGDIQLVTNTSYSLLAYKNTSATKCADGSIFGSKDAPSYLRSSSDDLYHYNANKDANYKILDSNNSAHTHSYLPLRGGTVTGGTTFSGGSFGTELIVKRGDTSNGASVQFRGTDEVYGYLGSNSVKQPTWWDANKTAYTLLHSGNSAHTHSYLPLSGGTMSGAISFDTSTIASIKYRGTKSEYTMIRFVDNTADAYGNGICIGGGGLTVIGGGESSYNAITDLGYTGGDERMVITNDADIEFYSNCQTISAKTLGLFDASGYWRGKGFKRSGSSDSYVLLGGGGHKELSGFSLTSHTHNYLPLSGGTMNTGASITIPYSSGSRKAVINGSDVQLYGASSGNWADSLVLNTNDGTSAKLEYGAYGNANTIHYGFIGTAYNTPTVKIIDGKGIGVAGSVRVGATKSNETTMTGGCNMEYNTTTQCLEFKFT